MAVSDLILKKTIKFDKSFKFYFVESKDECYLHPASEYYLKASDFSINILISFKWIFWGYEFFKSLSIELEKLGDDFSVYNLLDNCIQEKTFIDIPEKSHMLLIDNHLVNNYDDFLSILNNMYELPIFSENTKIHIKLKVNLREFIILSNYLFPTMAKLTEI